MEAKKNLRDLHAPRGLEQAEGDTMQNTSPYTFLKNRILLTALLCLLATSLNLQAGSQGIWTAKNPLNQNQFIEAGRVPTGLNAEEWSGIQAQITSNSEFQAYLKPLNTGLNNTFGWAVAISGDTLVVGAPQWKPVTGYSGSAFVFIQTNGVWGQQDWLKPSNDEASADDQFGRAVAISGDTILVGAKFEDGGDTGVNGDDNDNTQTAAGAVYVFVRDGVNWAQQAYLKASNTESNDQFGTSVGISGDTAVVGAWFEGSDATGLNGDQTSNLSPSSGAAYVFVRSGITWSQVAYLKASNTGPGDDFGASVAISGDTLIVGAPNENSGIRSDQTDNSAGDAGAAYIFLRSGTNWFQEAYLKASDPDFDDQFGAAVAISGDTAIIGARREAGGSTGVNGNEGDNSLARSGAAYVFEKNGTSWSQQAYLKASNTNASDNFGSSVSISGDSLVVGAVSESSAAVGVDGDQADNSLVVAGAAYVFSRSGTDWSQQAYLKASNTETTDAFGGAVSISGNTVVSGATNEDSDSTGVNGDDDDNSATEAGAAYVYQIIPGEICDNGIDDDGDGLVDGDDPDCDPEPPPPPNPDFVDMKVRCLHEPLFPASGESVTIRSAVIDGEGAAFTAQSIEIYLDQNFSPTHFVENQSETSYTFTPSGDFRYGCRATNVWEIATSWHINVEALRTVDVGALMAPELAAIPIGVSGVVSKQLDVVFFADDNEYSSFTDPQFQSDVYSLIYEGYFTIPWFVEHQWLFNFWIATDSGDSSPNPDNVDQFGNLKCFKTKPENFDEDYSWADTASLVHTSNCRDGAAGGAFSIEMESGRLQVVAHETGHSPFGLSDEYPNKPQGYFEKNNFPNVFKTEQDCIDNAVARTYEASDCRLLATDNDNQEWWLGEPDYGTGINKIDEVKDLMQQTGGVIDLDGNTLDRYKVGNSERDPMGWFVARCRNGDC